MDGAFPEVTHHPFNGFDIIEIRNALGDSRAEGKAGIVWPKK